MKKLSLQWRLTIILAAFMTVSCLLLNLLISSSALMRIGEVESYIMEIDPAGQDSIVIDVDDSKLLTQIHRAQNTFRLQSIAATVMVILISGILTYFLAGHALALVRDIAGQHGGNVRITRSSETGTEVALTLPMNKQSV